MKTRHLSYKLRTKQVVLPVKKFVENLKDLPLHPEIGVKYLFDGDIVKCVERHINSCEYCIFGKKHKCSKVQCMNSERIDGKKIKIIKC